MKRLPKWLRRIADGLPLGEAGTAAVEFVLVAPILLALIYGAIIYAVFFATWIAVTEAASEGARASLAGLSLSERQSLASSAVNRVFSSYAPLLTPQNMTLSFPVAANASLFSLSVSYDFTSSGLTAFASFIPLPATNPAITVTVSNGGF